MNRRWFVLCAWGLAGCGDGESAGVTPADRVVTPPAFDASVGGLGRATDAGARSPDVARGAEDAGWDARATPVDGGGAADTAAPVGDTQSPAADAGEPRGDAAPPAADAAPPRDDAAPPRPDAGPAPVDCAPLGARDGWSVCEAEAERCFGVFTDGAGCAAYCAAAGLVCGAVYEDIEGACAPDLDRPPLPCDPGSGHESDYCACVRPDDAPPPPPDPPPARPWEDLGPAVGYGRAATGGRGGAVCWVDSLADGGDGTLRACATRGEPTWVRFRVSGDINLSSKIQVASDTTIDGRGQAIRIRRHGLELRGVRNVILHNLRFDDGAGDDVDALSIIDGARDVWVDHVTFADFSDGLLDITRAATNVTVSWCHFRNHDKTMLIGASVDHDEDAVIRVTLHHNWFERTNQRHPRLRYGRVHVFNTFYDRWGRYGIGASQRGEVRSEGNDFRAGDDRDATETRVGDDPDPGRLRSDGDRAEDRALIREREREQVFDPRDDYDYQVEPADDALRARITAGAGWQDVPMP